jgi:hypothetical protein
LNACPCWSWIDAAGFTAIGMVLTVLLYIACDLVARRRSRGRR